MRSDFVFEKIASVLRKSNGIRPKYCGSVMLPRKDMEKRCREYAPSSEVLTQSYTSIL